MRLEEVLSLRDELTAEFAGTRPLALVQKRLDRGEANDFVLSLQEQPLRHLPKLFHAQQRSLVRAARLGQAVPDLSNAATLLTAHGDEPVAADLSIGYSAVTETTYRLEVRIQHPDVWTMMFAQDIAARTGGEVRVAEYRDLKALAPADTELGHAAQRLLPIGASVGHPRSSPGTLGLFVRSGDRIGILSNSHILACCGRATVGDAVHAPHRKDDSNAPEVARLDRFSDLLDDGPVAHDAALALLEKEGDITGNVLPSDCPEASRPLLAVQNVLLAGDPTVRKIGRSSRSTTGTLTAVGIDAAVVYPRIGEVKLTGMLEVGWSAPNSPFSVPGDSGSVVYRPGSMEAIGLVVGGGARVVDGVREGVTIVMPLQPVMTEWGLTWP